MEIYLQRSVRNKHILAQNLSLSHTHVTSHLQSLIAGVKQQFNSILSQVENEVVAEWHLFEGEKQVR